MGPRDLWLTCFVSSPLCDWPVPICGPNAWLKQHNSDVSSCLATSNLVAFLWINGHFPLPWVSLIGFSSIADDEWWVWCYNELWYCDPRAGPLQWNVSGNNTYTSQVLAIKHRLLDPFLLLSCNWLSNIVQRSLDICLPSHRQPWNLECYRRKKQLSCCLGSQIFAIMICKGNFIYSR